MEYTVILLDLARLIERVEIEGNNDIAMFLAVLQWALTHPEPAVQKWAAGQFQFLMQIAGR